MSAGVEQARKRLRAVRPPDDDRWTFPVLDDFLQGTRVMAFDATLSHCGWAGMSVWDDRIEVWAKGTIHPVTQRLSYLGTWEKARMLHQELMRIDTFAGYGAYIVVEAPSVGGGHRTESSLIAGLMVTMLRQAGGCTAVSATHVSAVLLGDPKVRSAERKKRIREAVIRLIPAAADRDWNEHIRDAAATGLAYLHDQRRLRVQQPYLTGES